MLLFKIKSEMTSDLVKVNILSGLFGFSLGLISLWLTSRWYQRQEKWYKSDLPTITAQDGEVLHWNPLDERRGLGDLILKVNHIALTVSDVGRSLQFYVDILGLQQVRRPNFDRHGAWLTMGNVELHLIKGIPAIPPVDNLQVTHIAFETSNINEVLSKLRQFNIEVRQNLSITKAQKSTPKQCELNKKPTIVQYFFSDPDGYFWELCNCDILTQFALNKNPTIENIQYHQCIPTYTMTVIKSILFWKRKIKKHRAEQFDVVLEKISRATQIDEDKFSNLAKRRSIYGDIMQGFTDEDIKETLLNTNNHVPSAIKILTHRRGSNKFYQPPSFLENGELTKPESFTMNQKDFIKPPDVS
jgi:catechol 2,3-dioxygenase-like lactoylglutathione lyase family enzyme